MKKLLTITATVGVTYLVMKYGKRVMLTAQDPQLRDALQKSYERHLKDEN